MTHRTMSRHSTTELHLTPIGIRHMVTDHLDINNENLLPPIHGLLFTTKQQEIFYMHLCHTSCGSLAGMRNSLLGP